MAKIKFILFLIVVTITLSARTIKVGVFPNAPIIYQNNSMEAKGIYADLLYEIAAKEGWDIQLVPGYWAELLDKLKNSEIDLMVAITDLEEREPYLDFSEENIFIMWGEIYTNKKIKADNITDLAGKRIGSINKNANSIHFNRIMSELSFEFVNVVYESYDLMFEAIRDGIIDAGICNNIYGSSNYEYYDLNKPLIMFQPYRMYFAVPESKNQELLTAIDNQIKLWKKDDDSFFYKTLNKWYGYNKLELEDTSSRKFIYIYILTILLFAIMAFLFTLRNKQRKNIINEKLEKEYWAVKERYKNLLKISNDGILFMDNNENIFEVNPAMSELFGYTPNEFLKLGLEELFQKGKTNNLENLRIAMDQNETFFGNIYGITKENNILPTEVSGTPLELNRKRYYFLTIQNIDNRLKMEDDLLISETRMQRVFESDMMGVMLWDWDGNIIDTNNKFLEIVKYTREDFEQGINWRKLTPPGYEDIDQENFQDILENGSCKPFEKEYIRKDGTHASILIGAAMLDHIKKNGIAFVIDISEKKKIEHELAVKQQEIKQIYNMATPICLISIDHQILNVNDSFCGAFRLSEKDILSNTCNKIWSKDECENKNEVIKKFLNGEKVEEYEINRNIDGKKRFYNVASKPYYGLSGTLVGIVENYFDITDWKATEAKLKEYQGNLSNIVADRTHELESKQDSLQQSQQALTFLLEDVNDSRKELSAMNQKLEQANADLESFAYSVSHDLRAPLRHISGFSQLLMNNYSDGLAEKAIHYLNTIVKSTVMMGTLIDDLLVFSRMGRTRIQKLNINLNSMVADIIDDMSPDYEPGKIEWNVKELIDVYGDPTLIRQVFINLIANSIKFSKHCDLAKIEIGCKKDKDQITYFVIDNGVGFDMRYVDKLFGVFQRLHRQEDFEGTGIGLANVKRIVTRHGGRVWAEGVPNEGASFYIQLPYIEL